MNTKQTLSKYQTWQPWISEYNRLTLGGIDNRAAIRRADALIETKRAAIQAVFANK